LTMAGEAVRLLGSQPARAAMAKKGTFYFLAPHFVSCASASGAHLQAA
jgi:hypothetical protein